MKREIDIIQISVMKKSGDADKIIIRFRGDSPYPKWLPDCIPTLSMSVEEGIGIDYIKTNFNITPDVIHLE